MCSLEQNTYVCCKPNELSCAMMNHSTFLLSRTMSKLYEDANWSQKDLSGPIDGIRKCVTKNKLHCFSLHHMKYYENKLCERKQEGHKVSFTDLWGLFIDSMLHHQVFYILSLPLISKDF